MKLERSIASNRELLPGEVISEKDLHMLSPGDGYKWSQKDVVIGSVVKNAIAKNEIIYPKDIEK